MELDAFYGLFATVRELGTSASRQRGFVAFRGEAIQFDSSYEYEFLKRAATDTATLAIVSQPCRIHWRDGSDRPRRYVPDYAVLYQIAPDRAAACVVEVKPLRFACALRAEERCKYEAARAWAERREVGFGISAFCSVKTLDILGNLRIATLSAAEVDICISHSTVKQKQKKRSLGVPKKFTLLPKSIQTQQVLLSRLEVRDSCGYLLGSERRSQLTTVKATNPAPSIDKLLRHAMEWAENCVSSSASCERNRRSDS